MYYTGVLHICMLGFISGKRKAIIPWAKLAMDPTAWIDEECYPPGFQWADPSKIQMGQVFQLLDHWRQRQESGLTPLIWNPSCELLANAVRKSKKIQSRGQSQSDPDSDNDSGEEDFAAQLENISEKDPEADHARQPRYSAEQHHSCKSELLIYSFHPTHL